MHALYKIVLTIPIMALNGITGELRSNYRCLKGREEEPGLNQTGPSVGVQQIPEVVCLPAS